MDCDAIRPDLEVYALGALDEVETAVVAAHLAGCPRCRAEQAALEAAAHALPSALAAASDQAPPARLKERLLTAIAADALDELRSATPAAPTTFPASLNHAGPGRPRAEAAPPPSGSVGQSAGPPAGRRSISLWRRPPAWAGLAAAVLLIASLTWGARLSEALDRERALRETVAGFYSEQQAIVFDVVDSDETTKRLLLPPEGSDFPTRPYGKVFTRAEMTHVVAMANRLPESPEGQSYHLWVTLDGRPHLAGVLDPNDAGFAVLVFDADRPDPAYSAAWITLQPTSASEPGGTMIIAWGADSA